MSLKASNHLVTLESSEDLIVTEPWTVETYADGLMDELFTDIDQILDGNATPHQPKRTAPAPQHKVMVTVPQVVWSQTVESAQTTRPKKNKKSAALVVTPPIVTTIEKHESSRTIWDKLLLAGVTLSVAAGIIYLMQSGVMMIFHPETASTPQPQVQLPQKKDAMAEFVDYMSRSLIVIDKPETNSYPTANKPRLSRNIDLNQSALPLPSVKPLGNLPVPLNANNILPTNNRNANVIERIYIPMSPLSSQPSITGYNPPKIGNPPTQSSAPLPQPLKTKPVNKTLPAIPIRPQNPISIQSAAPIPKPQLPTVPLAPAAPVIQGQLVGLLELGSKSAALFKIEGATLTIKVGESIGTTGWTLVEVNRNEAVVRRNGEVRSIYTGQKL